jgi:hypothetical protein
MHPSRLIAIAPAWILTACGAGSERPLTAERSDSAGIEIVMNRGPDRALSWTFTRTLTLGGDDEGPESFYRVIDGRVGFDAAGNIYVLDSEAQHVLVFDATGTYLRTMGAPGQGPGEIQFPGRMHVSPEGVVSVLDFSKQGVLQWGPDGAVLDLLHLPNEERASRIAFVSGNPVFSWSGSDSTIERRILARAAGDSIVMLATLELPRPKMATYERCRLGLAAQPYFVPSLEWSAAGERIAASSSAAYEVDVRDPAHRMLIRRDLQPVPTTPELLAREIGDSMRVSFGGGAACAIPADEVAEARGYAPVVPAIRSLIVAPNGELWIRRGGPFTDPPLIDVFDRTGEYLGTLPAGSPLPIAFTPSGGIAAIDKDEASDVERLAIYTVVRGGGGVR